MNALVASGRSSRWTGGHARPGGLGLPPTSRSPARRDASARTLRLLESQSQEQHGALSTPSAMTTALSAIGTQLVEISALLSHLGLAEHDSALRGVIRRRLIHSPDALAHLLTTDDGWHSEVGMRKFELGRFVHAYQEALCEECRQRYACTAKFKQRWCRLCALENRRPLAARLDPSSVPSVPLTLPTLADALVMRDGTVISTAEDFLRATRLSRFSRALLEDGGLVIADIPVVNADQLELGGMANDLHRKRFLRESAAAFPLSFMHRQAGPDPRVFWREHMDALGITDETMPLRDITSQLGWLYIHCNRARQRDDDDVVDIVLFAVALRCSLAHRSSQRFTEGGLRQVYIDLIETVRELSLGETSEPVGSTSSAEDTSVWFDKYLQTLDIQESPVNLHPEQERKLRPEPEPEPQPEPEPEASQIECLTGSSAETVSTIKGTDQPQRVESDSSIIPMIRARQWDWMIDTLRTSRNPSACASQTERTGKTPLHMAILTDAPQTPIRALISAYPDACRQKDEEKRLPLHYAVMCESSVAVVKELLDVYPEGCFVPDPVGVLPLQAARLRVRSRLSAATSLLKQDLQKLQLPALIARASQRPGGDSVSIPEIDPAASKQEQRETMIAHLIDSDLVLRRIQQDEVVAALSAAVESRGRAVQPSLHPEAYERKDGQLGGTSDGESSSHTLLDAMARCTSLSWAVGFTYRGPRDPSPTEVLDCIFFRTIDSTRRRDLALAGEWHSYLKVVQETLSPTMDQWARMQKQKQKQNVAKLKRKQKHYNRSQRNQMHLQVHAAH